MLYAYEATFEHMTDESGNYWYVEFPQLPGAFTDGETVDEACHNAAEALTAYIASCIDRGESLPEPSFHEPPLSVVCVSVDDDVVEASRLVSVTQAAEELGVTPQRVSQLLSAGKLESQELHGRRMVTIASLNARKANPPAPHRPRREAAVA